MPTKPALRPNQDAYLLAGLIVGLRERDHWPIADSLDYLAGHRADGPSLLAAFLPQSTEAVDLLRNLLSPWFPSVRVTEVVVDRIELATLTWEDDRVGNIEQIDPWHVGNIEQIDPWHGLPTNGNLIDLIELAGDLLNQYNSAYGSLTVTLRNGAILTVAVEATKAADS